MNTRRPGRRSEDYGDPVDRQSRDPFYGSFGSRDERGVGAFGENPYGYYGQYRYGRDSDRAPAGVEELDLSSGVDINAGIELCAGDDVTGARMKLRSRRPPKGYRRSDERLRDDVYQRLLEAHEVDVSDVSFDVRDGIVTLEGSVPQRRMRYVLEDLVAQCPGVRDVENRITVQLVAK